jgi:hypothetical protein
MFFNLAADTSLELETHAHLCIINEYRSRESKGSICLRFASLEPHLTAGTAYVVYCNVTRL